MLCPLSKPSVRCTCLQKVSHLQEEIIIYCDWYSWYYLAVILEFKAMLLLKQIRKENEMRVAAVFLTGMDMIWVFFEWVGLVVWNVSYEAELCLCLSISKVSTSDKYHSALHSLNYNSRLETILNQIRATIKNCGNGVDAYYKQSRACR